jgi:hypothetical protein
VQGKRILNQFDQKVASDRLFRESFTEAERQEIRETLQHVERLTARVPTDQGTLGKAVQWVGRAAGIGSIAHGDPITGLTVEAASELAPYLIAAALRTSAGRAAVRTAFAQGGGRLTPAGLTLINQAVREGVSSATEPTRDQ